MGSGIAATVLFIAAALIAIGLMIRNLLGLSTAMRLLSDSKTGRLLKVKSVIKWSVRTQNGGSLRAVAEYAVGERKIRGKMIDASREHLNEGQTIRVLISEKNPRYFAVNERQIKNSVTSYVMMCVIFLVIAVLLIFFAICFLPNVKPGTSLAEKIFQR